MTPKGTPMINTREYKKTSHQGLKIHVDGVSFLFDIKVNKKRYRKQFKANENDNKADRLNSAYIALNEFRSDTLHKDTIVADVDATVLDYWIKLKAVKGWTAKLIINYDYYYDKHLDSLSDIKIKDVRPSHFTSINASLNGYATQTRRKAYEILKPLFDLAVEDEIIKVTPIKKSHIPVRKQLEEKKIIVDADVKYRYIYKAINEVFGVDKVLEYQDGTKIVCQNNPHHRALFLFGFHGRRLNETLNLRWSDIDFVRDTYIVRGTNSKVNTDMTFTLTDDVRECLYNMNYKFDSDENIFQIKHIKNHYKKIREHSAIPEFSYHWMRNLAVSALASMGADVTHLSAMLGHNDAGTLKKYLSLQRVTSTAITNDMTNQLLGLNEYAEDYEDE